jgi:hypothetical protein
VSIDPLRDFFTFQIFVFQVTIKQIDGNNIIKIVFV